eukprot:TRINITY_DN2738_c0_g1_i1.p2 TRINITY_DN2738_c0_g1~~TRINITY_DN2738_c0_g1_i1.p2  ORF type:complete len:298 (+),score=60.81 TRINITY_DN2738_c0_g1_i1:63-956(+)
MPFARGQSTWPPTLAAAASPRGSFLRVSGLRHASQAARTAAKECDRLGAAEVSASLRSAVECGDPVSLLAALRKARENPALPGGARGPVLRAMSALEAAGVARIEPKADAATDGAGKAGTADADPQAPRSPSSAAADPSAVSLPETVPSRVDPSAVSLPATAPSSPHPQRPSPASDPAMEEVGCLVETLSALLHAKRARPWDERWDAMTSFHQAVRSVWVKYQRQHDGCRERAWRSAAARHEGDPVTQTGQLQDCSFHSAHQLLVSCGGVSTEDADLSPPTSPGAIVAGGETVLTAT